MPKTNQTNLKNITSHIFLSPEALETDIWRTGTIREKLLMFTLLIFGNHEPRDHNGLKVPRGTVYMSRDLIQKIGGFRSSIRRPLEKLEKRGLIEISVKRKRLFIVINNFESCIDPEQGYDYGFKDRDNIQDEKQITLVPDNVPYDMTREPVDTTCSYSIETVSYTHLTLPTN